MIDRIFAAALFLLALGYGCVALTLHAPFQYDPLGPETWPRLLALGLAIASVAMARRPDSDPDWYGATVIRSLLTIGSALLAYAILFEPLGFILSTGLFCTLTARYLGADWARSALFGVGMGVGGYALCAWILALNVPAGLLPL